MTAIATPTTQVVSEWIKVFPRQVTENYTSSLAFMKQLTVVAISTITYLKNAFPEDSYRVEAFGGVKLRILRNQCRDDLAQFISTALTQAFEALNKKYLHQLALCFYENECKLENLIEYHIFEYSYHEDGVTMNVHSKNRDNVKHSKRYTFENVRERTIHMIRACVVIMESCQNELPSTYDVSLRLYYNEAAPANYQAPGYLSTDDNEDHLEPTLAEAVKLGWVETPFHRLIARSYIKEQVKASHEAIASQNAPMMSNEIDLSGSAARSEIDVQLQCPCNKYDGSDTCSADELITCDYCGTQQHAVCYGIRGSVTRHCCVSCALADDSRTATDSKLVTLNNRKRECLCIFRRTLDLCSKISTIEVQTLTEKLHITDVSSIKLMKLLYSHGIVPRDPELDPKTPQNIITDQLKSAMTKYFNTEGDIVDRLLAETSQESLSDPIGDVLSPLERVSLHNTSNIGRVIDANSNVLQASNINRVESNIEDTTLMQYKKALLSNVNGNDFCSDPIESVKTSVKRKFNDRSSRTGVRTKRARALP